MCTEPGIIAPGSGGFLTIWQADNDPVVIPSWVMVKGAGQGFTVIRSTVDTNGDGAVIMESNTALKAMTVDNRGANTAYAIAVGGGTVGSAASGVSIHKVTAISRNGDVIGVQKCSAATIKGSTLDGAKNAIERMGHPVLIALIRKQLGQTLDDTNPFLRQGQQRDAAIRRQSAAVECGDHLLRLDGRQGKRQQRIVGHGGCRWFRFVEESV